MEKREVAVSGASVGGGKKNWVELFSFFFIIKCFNFKLDFLFFVFQFIIKVV